MSLRALQIGVAHGVSPFEALGEKVRILVVFGSGRSFIVAEALVGIVAVAMLNNSGDTVLVCKLDEVRTEGGGRSKIGFAVDPMPVKNIIQAFGEFEFPP